MNQIKKSALFCILLLFGYGNFTACQPTPPEPVVTEQGGQELQASLNAAPLPAYDYISPREINDKIEMNTCTFTIKAKIERSESKTHPVFRMRQRDFSQGEAERICSELLQNDIVGARDASRATKEEIEEDIMILQRGIPVYHDDGSTTYTENETAKKVLPELYEKLQQAQSEVFEAVDKPLIVDLPSEAVFLKSDGSKAYCYLRENSLSVFTNDYGNIQMQSWIVREGGWDGEGPVQLSTSIPSEAAERFGASILSQLDIRNMELATIEKARMLNGTLGYDTLCTGWYLTYTRNEGKGIAFDAGSIGGSFMQFEDEAVAPPWPQETVSLFIDESGLRFFTWKNPCQLAEEINPNVELLPFEHIYARMITLLKQGFSWTDKPGIQNEDFYVNRILLTNCLVREKDAPEIAIWMPVWVFVYQMKSTLDNSVAPGYVAVNAVDGSRVQLID